MGGGSPFPVRYVSGGLLFLKPLGTSFTMLRSLVFVNLFLVAKNTFPRIISALFSSGYRNVM